MISTVESTFATRSATSRRRRISGLFAMIPDGCSSLFVSASAFVCSRSSPSARRSSDESRFRDPDTFNLEREEPSLSFGHGIHYCLGATLARLEANIAIEVLVSRFRSIELARGDLEYNRSLTVRGVVSLPMRFIPT